MNIQILPFLFLLTLLITDYVNARSGSSRGSSSRGHLSSRGHSSSGSGSHSSSSSSGSSSRNIGSGSSSGGYSTGSGNYGHGSSSGGHATGSSPTGYGSSSGGHLTAGSSPYGHGSSPSGRPTGSSPTGYGSSSGGHLTAGSSPYRHRSSSGGRTTSSSSTEYGSFSDGRITGSSPFGHEILSGGRTTGLNPTGTSWSQTSHQQNKDSSTSFIHGEDGGSTRPDALSYVISDKQRKELLDLESRIRWMRDPSRWQEMDKQQYPRNIENIQGPMSLVRKQLLDVESRIRWIDDPMDRRWQEMDKQQYPINIKNIRLPSTSFGQLNELSYNPSRGTASGNPSWSNPHFQPTNPYPPEPLSTKVGFKDHLRPTPMPVPSHVTSPPYPHSLYPISGSNSHPPPYPGHSFSHSNQSTYNLSYSVPGQTIGHPSSYPAHIPPPVPGTFGNPYSTHPVSGAYGAAGHTYYPQQHVLAQPAAQPYIPGQTVIMVPGQQDSGRGLGQLVKEAFVFSTVNAGVNRLLNPHHNYVPDYNRPSSGTSASETHITYNNHYFNTAPPDGTSPGSTPPGNNPPASPNVPQGNGPVVYSANSSPVNPNPSPVNNPVITPGVLIPTIVGNNRSVTYPAGGSPMNTVVTANNTEGPPVVSPNGLPAGNTVNNQEASSQATTINSPQYKISDNELQMLTEELFVKQEIDISKYLTLHLQSKSENVTDAAKGPLLYVQEKVYDYPTVLAIRALYDNYEHNSTLKETRTPEKRKKEDLLLDVFLNTNVMVRAMQWLSDRGFINPDDFEKKDILQHIWFNQFDGATSGFERVFTSERYDMDLLGMQDWIYFNYQESKNRIDYMGYVDILKLSDRASLVKLNFQMGDIIRPNATIFVGTLPELEMSLYTICFYARPNDLCPVSLGGAKFNIFTHSFRYYGKDLIDLALPIF